MTESNKMKDMPVNKLMVQMGIPMILSTVLFHIFDNALASYPDLISVLPDGQVVCLRFPAIVIQKQYSEPHMTGSHVLLSLFRRQD